MIVVTQAGQSGKTKLLFDMHRLRKEVFHDRMKWPVYVSPEGLESDQFDLPETVYLLSLNASGRVQGTWRLLPSTGPTMIRDIWPQFLATLPMPDRSDVWEVSRFAVDINPSSAQSTVSHVSKVTAELFCGLTELCLHCGINTIFTLYDARIARILSRLDCFPSAVSMEHQIDDYKTRIGRFETDHGMLARLRAASGIASPLLDQHDLPPAIEDLRLQHIHVHPKEPALLEA